MNTQQNTVVPEAVVGRADAPCAPCAPEMFDPLEDVDRRAASALPTGVRAYVARESVHEQLRQRLGPDAAARALLP